MKNNTCIICGNKFPPRKSRLYCNNKCKQKSFYRRKVKGEDNLFENSYFKAKYKYIFSKEEYRFYKHFKEKKDREDNSDDGVLSFEEFCFLRRWIDLEPDKGNLDLFKIMYCVKVSLFQSVVWDNYNILYTQFQEFRRILYSNEVLIVG